MTPTLIKSFRAAAAVAAYRFVAAANEDEAQAGADATDPLIGVSDDMGADAGGMLDVTQTGWAELKLGGSVEHGDPLTAGAEGVGIKAVPAAGSIVRYGAFAMSGGEDGDIIPVLVVPGIINTPAA